MAKVNDKAKCKDASPDYMPEESVSPLASLLSLATLSTTADALSIAGFLLTLWVAWQIREISTRFMFKARMPQLLEKLDEKSTSLSELLNDYQNSSAAISLAASETGVLLRSLKGKTSNQSRKAVVSAQKDLIAFQARPSEEQLRKLYVSLRSLELELREHLSDLDWEH